MLKAANKSLEIYLLLFFIIIAGYRYQLQDETLLLASFLILAVLLAAWLAYMIFKPAPLYWPDMKGLLAVFILAVISSVINATNQIVAFNELLIWIATAFAAFLIYNLIAYGYPARSFYQALLIVGAIYVALKIGQAAQLIPIRTNTCSKYLNSQNMTAAFVVMVMILAFSQLLATMKIWPGVLLAAAAGVLVLSGSRGGLVSAAVAMPAVYIYHDIKSDREIKLKKIRWLKYSVILFISLAATAALLLILRPVECVPLSAAAAAARPNEAWRGSIKYRFEMWKAALQMFKRRPLFGVGLANYELHLKPMIPKTEGLVVPPHAHSLYLSILAERGAAGIITTAAVLLYTSWLMWKHTENVTHAAAAQAAIIALLIHGIPDTPTKELFVIRYFILILTIGLASIPKIIKAAGGLAWLQRRKKENETAV